jgi:hypothetical protein
MLWLLKSYAILAYTAIALVSIHDSNMSIGNLGGYFDFLSECQCTTCTNLKKQNKKPIHD